MTTVTVEVKAQLQWGILRGGGGNWIGVCEPLGLTVQAATWANLMEDIGIALDSVMRNLLETGDLERFLKEHGWRLATALPKRKDDVRFDVPFFPAMMGQRGSKALLHK